MSITVTQRLGCRSSEAERNAVPHDHVYDLFPFINAPLLGKVRPVASSSLQIYAQWNLTPGFVAGRSKEYPTTADC